VRSHMRAGCLQASCTSVVWVAVRAPGVSIGGSLPEEPLSGPPRCVSRHLGVIGVSYDWPVSPISLPGPIPPRGRAQPERRDPPPVLAKVRRGGSRLHSGARCGHVSRRSSDENEVWPPRTGAPGKPEPVRESREHLPRAGVPVAGAAWSARWLPSYRRPPAARARGRG
jgi:hypothetical protein